jgi:hypothetical protein
VFCESTGVNGHRSPQVEDRTLTDGQELGASRMALGIHRTFLGMAIRA